MKPARLDFAENPHLVLRPAFGTDPFRGDAHRLRHGLTRGAGVTRDEPRLRALRLQASDDLERVWADSITDVQNSQQDAAFGQQQCAVSGLGCLLQTGFSYVAPRDP